MIGLISVSALTSTILSDVAIGQTDLPQASQPAAPGGTLDDTTYRQQVGYMVGRNIGNDLRESGIELDLASLFAGIRDTLSGAAPRFTEAELQGAAQRFQQEMQQKNAVRMQQAKQFADQNAKQAAAFLTQNRAKEGVQATASGLQYRVLKQGTGPSPTLADTVRCHYRGTLIDGTEFDSSYGGDPAVFPVRGVISGWTEALQKMRVGDKWQLFVPADLAYGDEPPGPPIGPNSLLIFEVELLGINGQ